MNPFHEIWGSHGVEPVDVGSGLWHGVDLQVHRNVLQGDTHNIDKLYCRTDTQQPM